MPSLSFSTVSDPGNYGAHPLRDAYEYDLHRGRIPHYVSFSEYSMAVEDGKHIYSDAMTQLTARLERDMLLGMNDYSAVATRSYNKKLLLT